MGSDFSMLISSHKNTGNTEVSSALPLRNTAARALIALSGLTWSTPPTLCPWAYLSPAWAPTCFLSPAVSLCVSSCVFSFWMDSHQYHSSHFSPIFCCFRPRSLDGCWTRFTALPYLGLSMGSATSTQLCLLYLGAQERALVSEGLSQPLLPAHLP